MATDTAHCFIALKKKQGLYDDAKSQRCRRFDQHAKQKTCYISHTYEKSTRERRFKNIVKNLHSITTLIVTNNHNNNYNNSNNNDHNDDNKSNSNDNFICLLIRIIVTLHCNSIFVRFLFHTTRHSAFQNIPPFRHSIIPSNGVALLNSSYRISDLCSLHKFSRSFEHLSLIEMVK